MKESNPHVQPYGSLFKRIFESLTSPTQPSQSGNVTTPAYYASPIETEHDSYSKWDDSAIIARAIDAHNQLEDERAGETIIEAVFEESEDTRQKIVQRRAELNHELRQKHELANIDDEEHWMLRLGDIKHHDPILGIAERMLLNVCTDIRSEHIISIQKAKTEHLIDDETTPFSFPNLSKHHKSIPYYISNRSVYALYEGLHATPLRDSMIEDGNFLETEEMLIAVKLEAEMKLHFNHDTKHVELEEDSLAEIKVHATKIALERIDLQHQQDFRIKTKPSGWRKFFC